MSLLQHARSFRDLIVYQKARAVAKRIFEMTSQLPREEMYSLTDQARRSSRSVGAQIAEAWAKRRYPAHFVSKLTDSDGELQETRHWLASAFACRYLSDNQHTDLLGQADVVGRMLGTMIRDFKTFTL